MLDHVSLYNVFKGILGVFFEVLYYWQLRIIAWWNKRPREEALGDALANATEYEQWESAAFQLDEIHGNDLWRQNPTSKFYDYRLIYERLQAIIISRECEDVLGLVNLLRSGLVRNLGNITAPRLFNRAYAGTKLLIEDYVTHVALAVSYAAAYPTDPVRTTGFTSQAKLDLLHDTRQAFGRSALVLQGGATFGLCHLGVVKALHLRGLLPRIVAGTASGALIAALVGIHTEDELLEILRGDRIDLSAFDLQDREDGHSLMYGTKRLRWLSTFLRRLKRYSRDGYFLDVGVLEDCVRANVGEWTFEEAYARTKRILNITLPVREGGEVPSLLNYITAPNVVIWSAAIASNAAAAPLYSPTTLLCKDSSGNIQPWLRRAADPASSKTPRSPAGLSGRTLKINLKPNPSNLRDSPLSRISELFNVNHFIVSQARPSIAPFLQTSDVLSNALPRHTTAGRRGILWQPLRRLIVLEIQHRLRQMDTLGLLPSNIRRFVLDETMPGASLTVVPELTAGDFLRLFERPTSRSVDEWILRGERSVWPAVGALKVRSVIELELDKAYQLVRRRKPMDAIGRPVQALQSGATQQRSGDAVPGEGLHLKGSGEKRRRKRADSLDDEKRISRGI